MNSSKSGARSTYLPSKEFHGGEALLGRARQPVTEGRPSAGLFLEGCDAKRSLQVEGHRPAIELYADRSLETGSGGFVGDPVSEGEPLCRPRLRLVAIPRQRRQETG